MSATQRDNGLAEDPGGLTIRIDVLAASQKELTSVERDEPLGYAIDIMQNCSYSQLPVMHAGRLAGAISWESIGRGLAQATGSKLVGDCMVDAEVISIDAPLLDAVERIKDTMYVLVRGKNGEISGIVTAWDIADQFKKLAEQFLAIQEIERSLRRLVEGKFSPEELKKSAQGRREKERIQCPDDLSLGNFCNLFDDSAHWNRLKLKVDKERFASRLDSIRCIRNRVMHFRLNSPAQEDTERLQQFVDCLRELVGQG